LVANKDQKTSFSSQAELAPTESVSRKQRTENSRQEAASNWQN